MTPAQQSEASRLADWLEASGVCNVEVRATVALLRELAAEPQGETVAWIHPLDMRRSGFGTVTFAHASSEQIPLFTDPPQRQPLTPEQIKAIWCQCKSTTRDSDPRHVWWSAFARGVERAHGIGETPLPPYPEGDVVGPCVCAVAGRAANAYAAPS